MSVAAALPHIYFLSKGCYRNLWQKISEISPRRRRMPKPTNTLTIGGIAIKVITVSFHIL